MRLQVCAALFALSTTVLAADKPQFGTWGFDAPGMDARTRPGDDFFRHVNGVWLDRTKIPPDKPAFSLRILMTVHTEQRLHDMMEEAAKKNGTTDIEGKIGAFYKAFMDGARIESLGAKPIAPEVDLVRAANEQKKTVDAFLAGPPSAFPADDEAASEFVTHLSRLCRERSQGLAPRSATRFAGAVRNASGCTRFFGTPRRLYSGGESIFPRVRISGGRR